MIFAHSKHALFFLKILTICIIVIIEENLKNKYKKKES